MLKNRFPMGHLLLDATVETGGNSNPGAVGEADDTSTQQVSDEQLDSQLDGHEVDTSGLSKAVEPTTSKKKDEVVIPTHMTGDDLIGDLEDESDKGIVTQEKLDKAAAQKVVEKPAQQVQQAQQTAAQQDPNKRDYSIFKEDDAKILRQAGNNPVFNWAKERLPKLYAAEKELAETKTKLEEVSKGIVRMPESYNEHPEAYKLSQEYSNGIRFYQQASLESEHWLQQLQNCKAGEQVYPIKGISKNGELVLGEPIDATPELEVKLQQSLNKAEQYKDNFAAKLGTLREGHVTNYKKMVQAVQAENAKYFPWVTNEKMLKEVMIEVLLEKDKPPVNVTIEQALNDAFEMLPVEWRSHPLAQAQANLIVSNLMASQKIRMLQEENAKTSQVQKDIQRAEPQTSQKSSGAASASRLPAFKLKGKEEIGSLDDME